MAGHKRIIFNGAAGERWKNTTGRVQYQLLASWANTCGVCAQYDRAIGPAWPLPYHRNCRCRMVAVVPGQRAEPFVDFRVEAAKLDDSQKRALVGAANYRLIQSKTVAWDDVVTPYRVRPLREVVALRKLTVETLTKAGVARPTAEKAWASAHAPEHQLVEAHRRELVSSLEGAGLDRKTIADLAAEGIASRVGIGGGPSGPGGFRETPMEERLKEFLATWRLMATREAEPEREPDPKPKKTKIAVEVKGEATAEEADELVAMIAEALPERVNRRLREFGTTFVHVGAMTEEIDDGTTPRGWPEGSGWHNVDGVYLPATKRVVVAKTYVDLKSKEKTESRRIKGVACHEIGHAVDASHKLPSQSKVFREAYDADVAAIENDDLRKRIAYFLQAAAAGRSEAFAELTAVVMGHRASATDLRDYFPKTLALMEQFYGDDDEVAMVFDEDAKRATAHGSR